MFTMATHSRRFRVGQLLVIGLIGLLGIQLTGLCCLQDEFDVAMADRVQVISTPSNEGSETSHESRDACPCHVTIAQGETLLLLEAFEHTRMTSPIPETYIFPIVESLFHPPISS